MNGLANQSTDPDGYKYAAWGAAMRIAYKETALLRQVMAERNAAKETDDVPS